MTIKIQKWGNSLGVRVPKEMARTLELGIGSEVAMVIDRRRLVLKPVRPRKPSLQELLARVTPDNRHEEIDWGRPVGKEIW